ncbi:hypothetical protein [Nitrococcus mobilis]|uniref:hypothetical protein n=1 Tax=Nitrococcus mobilis TaxID=35797 RepID=UPI000325F4DF|nr:hypothetical protein [Nitrococcus mobilis]
MSKTDITGEKLVYSMGKDKAVVDKADSPVHDASDGEKKKTLSQAGNKSTGRRPSSAGAKSRGNGDPYQIKPRGSGDDPYQSGRRVWPD